MDLFIFAGPNGSGKSSLAERFYKKPENKSYKYICPDNIALSMRGEYPDERQRYLKAMQIAEELRYSALDKKIPVCLETVLSSREKIDYILEAQKAGYKIHIAYVLTDSPEINLARVRKRASQGGHDVSEDKLIKRYYKSLEYVSEIILLADEIYIYDNSVENKKPKLIYCFNSEFSNKPLFRQYISPYVGLLHKI